MKERGEIRYRLFLSMLMVFGRCSLEERAEAQQSSLAGVGRIAKEEKP
jgi:hypothetical protein